MSYTSPTLTWTGDVAAGRAATVTYSVEPDETAPDGAAARDVVVGAGPATNCPTGTTVPACLAELSVSGDLVATGVSVAELVLLGVTPVAVGGALTVATSRVRRHRRSLQTAG